MPVDSHTYRLIPPNQPGGRSEITVTFVGEPWHDGSVRFQRGRTSLGTPVCVKTCDGDTGEASEQLARERQILERLHRYYPDAYPDQLARLVGADLDAEDPFVVTTFHGEPLDGVPSAVRFQPDSLHSAIDSLVLALRYLDSAKIVCRSLRPASLAWNGSGLQVSDFRWAAVAGVPRMPRVDHGLWSSPEQRKGEGTTECRDDVFGAAQLIFQMATGEDVREAKEMRARLREQDPELVRLLESAFADAAVGRPTSLDFLGRRSLKDPCPPSASGLGKEQENKARQRFQHLRDQQLTFLMARQRQREEEAERRRQQELAEMRRRHADLLARQEQRRMEEQRQRVFRYAKIGGVAVAVVTLMLLVLGLTGVI